MVLVKYRLPRCSESPHYDIKSLLTPSVEANNGNRNQILCVSLCPMEVEASRREDRFVFMCEEESHETLQGVHTWKTDTTRECRLDYNDIHLFSRDLSCESNIKLLIASLSVLLYMLSV